MRKKQEKEAILVGSVAVLVIIAFVIFSVNGVTTFVTSPLVQQTQQAQLLNSTNQYIDANWDFNDAYGNVATDSGPNSNTAVLQNIPDVTWVFPYPTNSSTSVLSFGGNTGYLSTTYYGIAGTNQRTFSAWILPSQSCGQPVCDILTYGSEAMGQRIEFSDEGNALGLRIYGAYIVYKANLLDGNWHFVSVSIPTNANLSQVKFYVDGKKLGQVFNQIQPYTMINTGQSNPVNIGRMYAGANLYGYQIAVNGAGYFKGMMDDLHVYTLALSDQQEQAVYIAGHS